MAILRGNFKPKIEVQPPAPKTQTSEQQFEDAAMKRLGGSVCFVAKKKVIWVKPA